MLDELLARLHQKDRLALARLLSLVARGEHIESIRSGLQPPREPGRVVALTGSGGVGKSTLTGKLIEAFRKRGQRVAVLACDPQSPLSGGALLGDRFRMPSPPDDDGVFIRSLAAASGHGALADRLPVMVQVLDTYGFDIILIETVGAGQGDTAVRELADVVVLMLQPETGDDLQWEKAGLMEVADVFVIHKADLPGAEDAAAQVRSALDLAGANPVPVLLVSSRAGQGIEALRQTIEASGHRRKDGPVQPQQLLELALQTLGDRFRRGMADHDTELCEVVDQWRLGAIPEKTAVVWLVQHLLKDQAGN